MKLISVAVPVFNPPERYLRAKLDSVLRQLDDNHCCSTLPALANRFVGPNQGAQLLGCQSLRPRGSCPAMGPLFKPGAGSGESQIGDIGRGSGRRSYHQQPWLSSLSAVPQARCARNPRRCQVPIGSEKGSLESMVHFGGNQQFDDDRRKAAAVRDLKPSGQPTCDLAPEPACYPDNAVEPGCSSRAIV